MEQTSRPILRRGVYAPILTTFKDDGSGAVDLDAFSRHVARLVNADVGIILGGTLGEGPLLSREERNALTRCARETIQKASDETHVPLIVGVMGASVHECVAMAKDAADAGADAMYGRHQPNIYAETEPVY